MWFFWVAWTGYQRSNSSKRSDVMTALLEPIFRGEYRHFAHGLELPWRDDISDDNAEHARTDEDLKQIGRLVMKYFAHNEKEADAFINALRQQSDSENGELANPHEALQYEFYDNRHDGPLMLASYRAILALMTNNNLPCFRSVDKRFVSEKIVEMEKNIQASEK